MEVDTEATGHDTQGRLGTSLRLRTMEKGLGENLNQVWNASIRDMVSSIGNAGLTRHKYKKVQNEVLSPD